MSGNGHSSNPRGRSNKRQNHNYLERQRRESMKISFDNLKETLPSFLNIKKGRLSRQQVLQLTAKYIRNHSGSKKFAIRRMREEKARVEDMIKRITAATESGDFEAAAPFISTYFREKNEQRSSLPEAEEEGVVQLEGGEEESTDSDDSEGSDENDTDENDSDENDSDENDSDRSADWR